MLGNRLVSNPTGRHAPASLSLCWAGSVQLLVKYHVPMHRIKTRLMDMQLGPEASLPTGRSPRVTVCWIYLSRSLHPADTPGQPQQAVCGLFRQMADEKALGLTPQNLTLLHSSPKAQE